MEIREFEEGNGGGTGGGGESCGESSNAELKRDKLRVLVVDHDQQFLSSFVPLLQSCSYNVTAVERASTALQIITEGQHEFDLMIADIHLTDVDSLTVLRLAVKMDLLAMLMTSKSDTASQHRALYNGALLLLEKPMTRELLMYLSQIVAKEKMRRCNCDERENIRLEAQALDIENINLVEESNQISNIETDHAPKKRGRKPRKVNYNAESLINKSKLKRKICAEWTQELHDKFLDAVQSLGDGRCYPMDILERMNVPGLTRMQVASHLQKCRNDRWRTVGRKPKDSLEKNDQQTLPNKILDKGVIPKSINKKFGSMPFHINPNDPQKPSSCVMPPPERQDPTHDPTNDPAQPKGTHQLIIPHHAQNQIMEQTREVEPLGSVSMSDNASNLTVGTVNFDNRFEMSNSNLGNASKNVAVGTVCALSNPTEMTSLNSVNEKFVAPVGPTIAIDPLATSSSHNDTIQSLNEIIYINPELDEYIRTFAGQDDELMNYNHNVRTQHVCDFDIDLPKEFSTGTNANGQTSEQWSSFGDQETSNIPGE